MKYRKGEKLHRGRDHPTPYGARTKGVALFTFIIFTAASFVWFTPPIQAAYPITSTQGNLPVPSAGQIQIPEEIGIIEEIYEAPSTAGKPPLVVYIQDAHCIYEAQSNIRKILDKLQKDHDLRLVALEGGAGKIDPTFFRTFPIQSVKEKVIDHYVRRGELSGAEYAAIVNERVSDFWGIEDMKVYYQNKDAFLKAVKDKERIDIRLDDINRGLKKLKDEIYSPELKELYAKTEDYETERLNLLDYVLYLTSLKPAKSTMIQALLQAMEREKTLPMSEVEEESALLTRQIERALKSGNEEALKEFESRVSAFKRGEVKRESYHVWLLGRAKDAGVLTGREAEEKYPQFMSYIRHVEEMEKIKGDPLFQELETLVRAIKEDMFQNDRQRRLDELFTNLKILGHLSKLELTREELVRYRDHPADFAEKNFWDFIGREPPNRLELDSMFEPHRAFYEAALARDGALHKNFRKLFDVQKRKFAAVITGGFHSDGVKDMFKRDGISYVLVIPRITQFEAKTPYWDVMQGKVSYARAPGAATLAPLLALLEAQKELAPAAAEKFIEGVVHERYGITLTDWRNKLITESPDPAAAAGYLKIIDDLIAKISALPPVSRDQVIRSVISIVDNFLQGEKAKALSAINQLEKEINAMKIVEGQEIINLLRSLYPNAPSELLAPPPEAAPAAAATVGARALGAKEVASEISNAPGQIKVQMFGDTQVITFTTNDGKIKAYGLRNDGKLFEGESEVEGEGADVIDVINALGKRIGGIRWQEEKENESIDFLIKIRTSVSQRVGPSTQAITFGPVAAPKAIPIAPTLDVKAALEKVKTELENIFKDALTRGPVKLGFSSYRLFKSTIGNKVTYTLEHDLGEGESEFVGDYDPESKDNSQFLEALLGLDRYELRGHQLDLVDAAFRAAAEIAATRPADERDIPSGVLQPVEFSKAEKESGLTEAQIELIKARSRGTMSIYEFLEKFLTKDELKGGYSLGLTWHKRIYLILSRFLGLQDWRIAYDAFFGSRDERTDNFMNRITEEGKLVVYFVPSNIFGHERAGVTGREMQWLLDRPEKMKNVYFVFGSYDSISEEDYKTFFEGKKDAGVSFASVFRNFTAHMKKEVKAAPEVPAAVATARALGEGSLIDALSRLDAADLEKAHREFATTDVEHLLEQVMDPSSDEGRDYLTHLQDPAQARPIIGKALALQQQRRDQLRTNFSRVIDQKLRADVVSQLANLGQTAAGINNIIDKIITYAVDVDDLNIQFLFLDPKALVIDRPTHLANMIRAYVKEPRVKINAASQYAGEVRQRIKFSDPDIAARAQSILDNARGQDLPTRFILEKGDSRNAEVLRMLAAEYQARGNSDEDAVRAVISRVRQNFNKIHPLALSVFDTRKDIDFDAFLAVVKSNNELIGKLLTKAGTSTQARVDAFLQLAEAYKPDAPGEMDVKARELFFKPEAKRPGEPQALPQAPVEIKLPPYIEEVVPHVKFSRAEILRFMGGMDTVIQKAIPLRERQVGLFEEIGKLLRGDDLEVKDVRVRAARLEAYLGELEAIRLQGRAYNFNALLNLLGEIGKPVGKATPTPQRQLTPALQEAARFAGLDTARVIDALDAINKAVNEATPPEWKGNLPAGRNEFLGEVTALLAGKVDVALRAERLKTFIGMREEIERRGNETGFFSSLLDNLNRVSVAPPTAAPAKVDPVKKLVLADMTLGITSEKELDEILKSIGDKLSSFGRRDLVDTINTVLSERFGVEDRAEFLAGLIKERQRILGAKFPIVAQTVIDPLVDEFLKKQQGVPVPGETTTARALGARAPMIDIENLFRRIRDVVDEGMLTHLNINRPNVLRLIQKLRGIQGITPDVLRRFVANEPRLGERATFDAIVDALGKSGMGALSGPIYRAEGRESVLAKVMNPIIESFTSQPQKVSSFDMIRTEINSMFPRSFDLKEKNLFDNYISKMSDDEKKLMITVLLYQRGYSGESLADLLASEKELKDPTGPNINLNFKVFEEYAKLTKDERQTARSALFSSLMGKAPLKIRDYDNAAVTLKGRVDRTMSDAIAQGIRVPAAAVARSLGVDVGGITDTELTQFLHGKGITDDSINVYAKMTVKGKVPDALRKLIQSAQAKIQEKMGPAKAAPFLAPHSEEMLTVMADEVSTVAGAFERRKRDLEKQDRLEKARERFRRLAQEPLNDASLAEALDIEKELEPLYDRTGANFETSANIFIAREKDAEGKETLRPRLKDDQVVALVDHLYPISYLNKLDPTYLLGDLFIEAQKQALESLKEKGTFPFELDISGKRAVVFGLREKDFARFREAYFREVAEKMNELKSGYPISTQKALEREKLHDVEKLMRTQGARLAYQTGTQINDLAALLYRRGVLAIRDIAELRHDPASEREAFQLAGWVIPILEDLVEQAKDQNRVQLNRLSSKYWNMGRIPIEIKSNLFNRSGTPKVENFIGEFTHPGRGVVVRIRNALDNPDDPPDSGLLRAMERLQLIDPTFKPETNLDLQPYLQLLLLSYLHEALTFAERNPRNHNFYQEKFFPLAVQRLLRGELVPETHPLGVNHVTTLKGDEHYTIFKDSAGKLHYLFIDFDNYQALDRLQRGLSGDYADLFGRKIQVPGLVTPLRFLQNLWNGLFGFFRRITGISWFANLYLSVVKTFPSLLPRDDGTFFEIHEGVDRRLEEKLAELNQRRSRGEEFTQEEIAGEIHKAVAGLLSEVQVTLNAEDRRVQDFLKSRGIDINRLPRTDQFNGQAGNFVTISLGDLKVEVTTKYADLRRPVGEEATVGFTAALTSNLNLTRNSSVEDIYDTLNAVLGKGSEAVDLFKGLGRKGEVVALNSPRYQEMRRKADEKKKEVGNVRARAQELRSTDPRLSSLKKMTEEKWDIAIQLLYNWLSGAHKNPDYVISELGSMGLTKDQIELLRTELGKQVTPPEVKKPVTAPRIAKRLEAPPIPPVSELRGDPAKLRETGRKIVDYVLKNEDLLRQIIGSRKVASDPSWLQRATLAPKLILQDAWSNEMMTELKKRLVMPEETISEAVGAYSVTFLPRVSEIPDRTDVGDIFVEEFGRRFSPEAIQQSINLFDAGFRDGEELLNTLEDLDVPESEKRGLLEGALELSRSLVVARSLGATELVGLLSEAGTEDLNAFLKGGEGSPSLPVLVAHARDQIRAKGGTARIGADFKLPEERDIQKQLVGEALQIARAQAGIGKVRARDQLVPEGRFLALIGEELTRAGAPRQVFESVRAAYEVLAKRDEEGRKKVSPGEQGKYHDLAHSLEVALDAVHNARLALKAGVENIGPETLEAVALAALFHDIAVVDAGSSIYAVHEELSAKIADDILKAQGVPDELRAKVARLILMTQFGGKLFVADNLYGALKDAIVVTPEGGLQFRSVAEEAKRVNEEATAKLPQPFQGLALDKDQLKKSELGKAGAALAIADLRSALSSERYIKMLEALFEEYVVSDAARSGSTFLANNNWLSLYDVFAGTAGFMNFLRLPGQGRLAVFRDTLGEGKVEADVLSEEEMTDFDVNREIFARLQGIITQVKQGKSLDEAQLASLRSLRENILENPKVSSRQSSEIVGNLLDLLEADHALLQRKPLSDEQVSFLRRLRDNPFYAHEAHRMLAWNVRLAQEQGLEISLPMNNDLDLTRAYYELVRERLEKLEKDFTARGVPPNPKQAGYRDALVKIRDASLPEVVKLTGEVRARSLGAKELGGLDRDTFVLFLSAVERGDLEGFLDARRPLNELTPGELGEMVRAGEERIRGVAGAARIAQDIGPVGPLDPGTMIQLANNALELKDLSQRISDELEIVTPDEALILIERLKAPRPGDTVRSAVMGFLNEGERGEKFRETLDALGRIERKAPRELKDIVTLAGKIVGTRTDAIFADKLKNQFPKFHQALMARKPIPKSLIEDDRLRLNNFLDEVESAREQQKILKEEYETLQGLRSRESEILKILSLVLTRDAITLRPYGKDLALTTFKELGGLSLEAVTARMESIKDHLKELEFRSQIEAVFKAELENVRKRIRAITAKLSGEMKLAARYDLTGPRKRREYREKLVGFIEGLLPELGISVREAPAPKEPVVVEHRIPFALSLTDRVFYEEFSKLVKMGEGGYQASLRGRLEGLEGPRAFVEKLGLQRALEAEGIDLDSIRPAPSPMEKASAEIMRRESIRISRAKRIHDLETFIEFISERELSKAFDEWETQHYPEWTWSMKAFLLSVGIHPERADKKLLLNTLKEWLGLEKDNKDFSRYPLQGDLRFRILLRGIDQRLGLSESRKREKAPLPKSTEPSELAKRLAERISERGEALSRMREVLAPYLVGMTREEFERTMGTGELRLFEGTIDEAIERGKQLPAQFAGKSYEEASEVAFGEFLKNLQASEALRISGEEALGWARENLSEEERSGLDPREPLSFIIREGETRKVVILDSDDVRKLISEIMIRGLLESKIPGVVRHLDEMISGLKRRLGERLKGKEIEIESKVAELDLIKKLQGLRDIFATYARREELIPVLAGELRSLSSQLTGEISEEQRKGIQKAIEKIQRRQRMLLASLISIEDFWRRWRDVYDAFARKDPDIVEAKNFTELRQKLGGSIDSKIAELEASIEKSGLGAEIEKLSLLGQLQKMLDVSRMNDEEKSQFIQSMEWKAFIQGWMAGAPRDRLNEEAAKYVDEIIIAKAEGVFGLGRKNVEPVLTGVVSQEALDAYHGVAEARSLGAERGLADIAGIPFRGASLGAEIDSAKTGIALSGILPLEKMLETRDGTIQDIRYMINRILSATQDPKAAGKSVVVKRMNEALFRYSARDPLSGLKDGDLGPIRDFIAAVDTALSPHRINRQGYFEGVVKAAEALAQVDADQALEFYRQLSRPEILSDYINVETDWVLRSRIDLGYVSLLEQKAIVNPEAAKELKAVLARLKPFYLDPVKAKDYQELNPIYDSVKALVGKITAPAEVPVGAGAVSGVGAFGVAAPVTGLSEIARGQLDGLGKQAVNLSLGRLDQLLKNPQDVATATDLRGFKRIFDPDRGITEDHVRAVLSRVKEAKGRSLGAMENAVRFGLVLAGLEEMTPGTMNVQQFTDFQNAIGSEGREQYFDTLRTRVTETFDRLTDPGQLREVSEKLAEAKVYAPADIIRILGEAEIPLELVRGRIQELTNDINRVVGEIKVAGREVLEAKAAVVDLNTQLFQAHEAIRSELPAGAEVPGFQELVQEAVSRVMGPALAKVKSERSKIRATVGRERGATTHLYDGKTLRARASNPVQFVETLRNIGRKGLVVQMTNDEVEDINQILKRLGEKFGNAAEVMGKVSRMIRPSNTPIRESDIKKFERDAKRLDSGVAVLSPENGRALQRVEIGNRMVADVTAVEAFQEITDFLNEFVDLLDEIPPGKEGDDLRERLRGEFDGWGIARDAQGNFTMNLAALFKRITEEFKSIMKARVAA